MTTSADRVEPATPGEQILREQVASAFASIRTAALTDRAVAVAFSATMYWKLRDPIILAWLALHLSPALWRPLWVAFAQDSRARSRSALWARRYSNAILTISCVWGLAPLLFLPRDDPQLTALMIVVMMGTCATGALSVAALRPALIRFIAPMMTGLIIALVLRADLISLFLAACCAAFLATTLKYAHQQHRVLTQSLVARFEKEALANQLSIQMAATQRLSEEKTRFFAAASHDLRQPLHAIALFGAVLQKELQGQECGRHAASLMRAVTSLANSLDAMLDVSRLDAGVMVPAIQPVALNTLFQSLNHLFSAWASENDLELRLRASPLWVRSDPQLLQRLLSNLVENALKYTVKGGVLVVARARGEQVWIDVRDTGVGIAAEHLVRIFEEFYQVDNPGRDRSQGLGIGLSIVQRLSRLLDHPVQVRSRPGCGSLFRLVLPVAAGMETAAWQSESSGRFRLGAGRLPRRVLILDDETNVQDAMLALLRSYSVDADAVRDELQAGKALAEAVEQGRPYEALLCDYRLAGGADGLDAGLRLQGRYGPALRLLLVTGETAPERLQRVRDSKVAVLFKPVGAATLMQALAD
jgi:signal transduction histidine kinase